MRVKLENEFYHDGRGPKLHSVIWGDRGVILIGFEYYNPDDKNLKHILLEKIQAYSFATEEVHANVVITGESKAAIIEITNSEWLASLYSTHLGKCKHYQIMFYDEIYDVICEEIVAGNGHINA